MFMLDCNANSMDAFKFLQQLTFSFYLVFTVLKYWLQLVCQSRHNVSEACMTFTNFSMYTFTCINEVCTLVQIEAIL